MVLLCWLYLYACVYVIGKRFASPIKKGPREKRAKRWDEQKLLFSSSSGTVVGSSDSMPTSSIQQSNSPPLHTALVGQQFLTSESYEIHELPSSVDTKLQPQHQETDVTINTALLARIEFLEAENTKPRNLTEMNYVLRTFNIIVRELLFAWILLAASWQSTPYLKLEIFPWN